METSEANTATHETLSGVSLSSPPDEIHNILKPSSENDALCEEMKGVSGSGGPVVVEKTEVTVVKVIQESKDDKFENQEAEECLAEKNEGNVVNSTGNGTSLDVDAENSLLTGGDSLEVSLFGENEEGNPENKNYDAEQDDAEEDHDFVVGDFVWGKIKSHPWWPGQIYDPSDASYYAAALKRKGRLLVAYFGDGSFSWCSPSQLKPFIDCFQEMSGQSDSKKFVNAVNNALDQVSTLVESELTCKCHSIDRTGNVGQVNSGIKGVPVPKGNTIKVLIDRMQPVEILSILKDSARKVFAVELELENTVLKTWLSAFYRHKGGFVLPEYHDPKCIEGLEDDINGDSDMNSESAEYEYGDDKLYQRRKQKSVAELLGDPKVKKAKTVKDGEAKTVKDGGSSGKLSSGAKRERKPKQLVVSVTPENDIGGIEEETMSPRQRKKSKYLSPPYLSPIYPGKHSGSGSFKEPKTEPEKVPETESLQRRKSHRRARERSDSVDSKDSKDEQKMNIDTAVSVKKVLHGVLTAALNPFVEKKNLVEITEFISSFRSSIFEDGSGRKDPAMTLVIEFQPGALLPTKMELSKTYKKFGDLIKREIQSEESRVVVVFGNSSDAEAALVMSMEKKPFGEAEYYLSEEGAVESDVAFVKRRLVAMGETVRKCEEDEMSADVKASLEEGIEEVLEKVCKMREN